MHACGDCLFVSARTGGGSGGEREQAHPAAGGFAVDHLHAIAEAALGEQPMCLAGSLAGTGYASGEVDRDDVLAVLEQWLPDGEEVADRGLRGGGQLGIAAQPLVEALEAVHLQLALGLSPPSRRTN